MAIGAAARQGRFEDAAVVLGDRLAPGSVYRLLADEGHRLFPDGYFADLFVDTPRGRPTIPARTVATVMLLQSFEGLSDREACDRLAFDLRWQAAAGLTTRAETFHPTVLVGMRNRLRSSERPKRLHEDTLGPAREAGVLRGRARVLDSTALYDAVATQDTVTQLRAAIRKVLATAGMPLAAEVRAALRRDDDYATIGKPPCDWDDPAAREALVDALVRDAQAALAVLHGHRLEGAAADAAALLALVAGQDVAAGEDGVFRIVRGVPATGSSPPSTPRPATATRAETAASTATRWNVGRPPRHSRSSLHTAAVAGKKALAGTDQFQELEEVSHWPS